MIAVTIGAGLDPVWQGFGARYDALRHEFLARQTRPYLTVAGLFLSFPSFDS
jgi:hypothetical protein